MKVTVITVSDRAARGVYEDKSGAVIEKIILENYKAVEINRILIPDIKQKLRNALKKSGSSDFILTTGGTGIGPRDITPEVCRQFCDKEIPGISEAIRAESLKHTPYAMLSRGFAGVKGSTIIINLPGSVKAVKETLAVIMPVLGHALEMVKGKGH